MLKNKCIYLLPILFLFACSTNNNDIRSDQPDFTETVSDTDYTNTESHIIIDVEKHQVSDNDLRQSPSNINNDNIPIYQEQNNNIKLVESKKRLIKPIINLDKEPVSFSQEDVKSFFENIEKTDSIEDSKNYDSKSIKILIENYKNILQTSQVCCFSGIKEGFFENNIQPNEAIDILKADSYGISAQSRCILLSENNIKYNFPDKKISDIIINTRHNCICNNKNFLRKNINNFYKLYNENDEFYKKFLKYRHKDVNGKILEDDVNESILKLAFTLESCP